MSTPLTPTPNPPPSTYPLIAPGDGVTSANFAQTAQPIIDAIAWLRTKLPGANPSGTPLDLVITAAMGTARATTVGWTRKGVFTDPDNLWVQTNNTIGDAVSFLLDGALRQGMVIRAFSCDFLGGPFHSALPAQMPVVQLVKIARGIGTNAQTHTTIDQVTDGSASFAALELIHTISRTMGAPETVDLSAFRYQLNVYGEGGANAQNNAVIVNCRVSVSA